MSNQRWPDSRTFWRDKRVVVTGGAGFLGSFVVEKLHARGADEVFVPLHEDVRSARARRDLPTVGGCPARYYHPPGGAGGRHWRESGASGGVLLR